MFSFETILILIGCATSFGTSLLVSRQNYEQTSYGHANLCSTTTEYNNIINSYVYVCTIIILLKYFVTLVFIYLIYKKNKQIIINLVYFLTSPYVMYVNKT